MKKAIVTLALLVLVSSCKEDKKEAVSNEETASTEIQNKLNKYVSVKLTTDLTKLSENERKMLPMLIKAADKMNDLFWYEAYGDKSQLLDSITDEATKTFAKINYGPWDRLDNNKPFVEGVGEKPAGANFYPTDMTKEEFQAADIVDKTSIYNFVCRDENGQLYSIPYHKQFEKEVKEVSFLLFEAAKLAEDEGLQKYLELRALALLDDNYQPSDLAWMDMKTNTLDLVIGPIETYEDHLFGNKAAHEAYVLVKDQEWSARLAKFSAYLPELQKGLPVDEAYKKEWPLIILSASGGARMHEGVLSLMQLAKTSAKLAKLASKNVPFISILTNPTTGGTTASYAMLGDVNIAEPGALIGFAGPRVIKQTIGQDLPEGFQRSEFVKDHGFLDAIIHRHELKQRIADMIVFFSHENPTA